MESQSISIFFSNSYLQESLFKVSSQGKWADPVSNKNIPKVYSVVAVLLLLHHLVKGVDRFLCRCIQIQFLLSCSLQLLELQVSVVDRTLCQIVCHLRHVQQCCLSTDHILFSRTVAAAVASFLIFFRRFPSCPRLPVLFEGRAGLNCFHMMLVSYHPSSFLPNLSLNRW